MSIVGVRRELWRQMPSLVRSVSGPALIILTVAAALHGLLVSGLFPDQFELAGTWTTDFCYLGASLRGGHVPAWNPHVMTGVPFAADPLHGWLNLLAMGTFSALPCAPAMRLYLILLPIIGGLGLYWFLREEGVSRVSATVGGLAVAMIVAGTHNLALPWVAGSIAWTAVVLACASRYLKAERWGARVLWAIACATAFGEVMAAHLSDGTIVAAGALIAYLAARLGPDLLSKRRSGSDVLASVGLLAATVLALSVAFVLPRVSYGAESTMSLGYPNMQALTSQYALGGAKAFIESHLRPTWPLSLGLAPGMYLGGATLILAFGGLVVRPRRALAVAFSAFALACYVLTLPDVAAVVGRVAGSSLISAAYVHGPSRLSIGLYVAMPVLAALGLEAWRDAKSTRLRVALLAPGALVWLLLPLAWGARGALVLVATGAVAVMVVLASSVRLAWLVALVPLVLALELCVNALPTTQAKLETLARNHVPAPSVAPFGRLAWLRFDLDAYVRTGSIANALRGQSSRYLTLDPRGWAPVGYYGQRANDMWPRLADQQAMLFGLQTAEGYNAIQLTRYWTFVRAADPEKKIRYAASYFRTAPPIALDLLQVGWIIGRGGAAPPIPGARPTVSEGRWALFRLPDPRPRASVVTSWRVAPSPEAALNDVLAAGFDPATQVILERSPRFVPPAGGDQTDSAAAAARYRPLGDQAARIDVVTPRPAVVLIRNAYDPKWRATVDGRATDVGPADYVDQAVAVGPGRHVIMMRYDDPTIGVGLAFSGGALATLLIASLILLRRRTSCLPAASARTETEGLVLPPDSTSSRGSCSV